MDNIEINLNKGFEVLTSKFLMENFFYEDGTLCFEKREIPTVLFSFIDYIEFCIRCKEKNSKDEMRKINNMIFGLFVRQGDIYNSGILDKVKQTMETITGMVFSKFALNNFYSVTKAFGYVFVYSALNRKMKNEKFKLLTKIRLSFTEMKEVDINIMNYLESRHYLDKEI